MMRNTYVPLIAWLLWAATILGYAPFGTYPLPFLTLAALFFIWNRSSRPSKAASVGFFWGFGFFLGGVSWIYVSLHDIGGMAAPLAAGATAAFCAFLALFPTAVGFASRFWAGPWRPASARIVLIAGLWTFGEWVRGWLLSGFPWVSVGFSQMPSSPLAGYAPLFGTYGTGFFVVLAAAYLANLAVYDPERKRARITFDRELRTFGAWLVVAFVLGAWLKTVEWTRPTGSPVDVAILQGNVPQQLKWNPASVDPSIRAYLSLAEAHPATLTILPESAIPLMFEDIPKEVLEKLSSGGGLLMGSPSWVGDGEYANTAVLVPKTASWNSEPSVRKYVKSHLVPFGEFVPPGFAWFFDYVNLPKWGFTPGKPGQDPLPFGNQAISPNVCYEDAFGNEIRQGAERATMLVNVSNTAWFGEALAQPQQLQMSQARAIETGKPVLRAANSGISAAIAPDGSVIASIPPYVRGGFTVSAQWYEGTTPYVRFGDAPIAAVSLLSVLGSVWALRPRKKGSDIRKRT